MKSFSRLGRKGFTLIEVIVVAAIIAILAGILVPMIFNQIDESKVTKAKGEVASIKAAVGMFRKDTGKWPVFNADSSNPANAVVVILNTPGDDPTDNTAAKGWTTGVAEGFTSQFVDSAQAKAIYDPSGTTTWKGPYLANQPVDPWGRKYFVNVGAFNTPGSPVWVISAGPDGKLTTEPNATEISTTSDDIGIRIQ